MLAVRSFLRFGLSYRDVEAVRRFFDRAIGATEVTQVEVVTDRAAVYPGVLDELVPAAWHRTEKYANTESRPTTDS